ARLGRTADRRVRRVLRATACRLAFLRAPRPAGKGWCRATAGLHGALVRARAGVRERARLPAAARRVVRRSREPTGPQDAALPPDRPPHRGTPGDAGASGDGPGHRPALGPQSPTRPIPAVRHVRLLAGPAARW